MEPKERLIQRIDGLLAGMELSLADEAKKKVSVSDYMRLLQFRRELADEERPREIKVTWIDSLEVY